MPRDFIRAEAGVEAAHDNRHATFPILARDLIRAFRGVGLDADCDQIRPLIEGDQFHPIIVEANLDILWRESRERRGGQWLHLPGSNVASIAGMTANTGVDDGDPHEARLSSNDAEETADER